MSISGNAVSRYNNPAMHGQGNHNQGTHDPGIHNQWDNDLGTHSKGTQIKKLMLCKERSSYGVIQEGIYNKALGNY